MLAIVKNEFFSSFKSFKSIFVIFFFGLISYYTSKILSQNPSLIPSMDSGSGSIYTSSIKYLVLFFGFLFVFSMSHDILNRELDSQTIRLLVTKVSRTHVIIGKVTGVFFFWLTTITFSFAIVSVFSREWFWLDFFSIIVFLFYVISLVMLVSTIISKPGVTIFLGIIISIALPSLGIYSMFKNNVIMSILKYALPYYTVLNQGSLLLVTICISIFFILISMLIFKRKDL